MQAKAWWQRGIIYEIYPRSFQDSNGDGIGDLPGLVSRLDYLVALGVDALWIAPVFPSPMADFGYDVADYCGIDPIFGTLSDFDYCSKRRMNAGLNSFLILYRIIPLISIRGSWRVAHRATTRNATGTCGVTLPSMAARRTTG